MMTRHKHRAESSLGDNPAYAPESKKLLGFTYIHYQLRKENPMSNEELNQQLYERLVDEQDKFRLELLALSPIEILRKAPEYYVREDVICCLEDHNLPDDQVKALLLSKTPLADIYARWDRYADNRLDDVRDCIHDHAEAAHKAQIMHRNDAR